MLLCANRHEALSQLLNRFGIVVVRCGSQDQIPGSFWGPPEAGLIGNKLFVRDDTPLHSALHEASHFICADEPRRNALHTDAGGDCNEENGVCYLQIVLSDHLPSCSREIMMADMDAWGYTFRLGSARNWFLHDSDDAQAWLVDNAILTADQVPTWKLRR